MAADNLTLNPGTGGALVRTLADSAGNEWPACVVAYATALARGANVLQVVTGAAGLPVAQQGVWTVGLSGPVAVTGTFWQATQPVSIAGPVPVTGTFYPATQPVSVAADVGVTQSGAWDVGIVGAVGVTGTFWQATQPVSLAGSVTVTNAGTFPVQVSAAIPAGANLIGSVAAGAQIASAFNGATAVTPQYAAIGASSAGATTVVAGVAGKRVYILRWSLSANGAVNINWQSHTTTGTATGLHYLTQFASCGGAYCPLGIFATAVGEGLDINLSAAVAVGGELTFAQF